MKLPRQPYWWEMALLSVYSLLGCLWQGIVTVVVVMMLTVLAILWVVVAIWLLLIFLRYFGIIP